MKKAEKVKLTCERCEKEFLRSIGAYNRNLKNNTKCFCSVSCSTRFKHENGIIDGKAIYEKYLKKYNIGYRDELSPFRTYLVNMRKSVYYDYIKTCNVTLEDLKNQWEKQNGICPYTGLKLEGNTSTHHKAKISPYKASVDRIDSSKGYEVDNIEFISLMAQYAKNRFAKEELIEFCKQVAANHST
jgi:hypothetical protein